jgi:predicted nucleic acid-binding protein
MKEVIDTRFLIEHFYSNKTETKQKTTQKLKELIRNKEGILPTITLCETIQITCQKRGREEAEIRHLSLIKSGLKIQNIDQNIAKEAALLKCKYKNAPLGDCLIAATAIINKAKILSDDPHYDTIKEITRTWI